MLPLDSTPPNTDFLSYSEALTELLLGLGRLCPRSSEYEVLYPASARPQLSPCGFYASIASFCQHVLETI